MKRLVILFSLLTVVVTSFGQKPEETEDWSRKPAVVTPGKNNLPPSDAIVLYSGKQDLDKWQEPNGKPARWPAADSITVAERTGSIETKQSFGDCQLHIVW